jgi:hypothetical protein
VNPKAAAMVDALHEGDLQLGNHCALEVT